MAHRLPRLAAAVLLALTSAGCPDDSVPTTPMPGGLDLAALLPAQRDLVRVTLEVSGGALAETELDLDDDLQTLSGTFDVQNVTAPTERELQLRVYGRFAEDSEEVLLGRLLKPITLQPEADVAIAFSSDDTFDSCGGEPGACAIVFDANRNGVSNIDDLLERERSGGLGIDPAPQAPYLVTSSEQLQFPSGVRLGSFARQLVVLENFGEHQVEITSAAVVGGQGFAISILDPTGQSVAPPGRSLVGGSFEGIAPGQEAFIAVSFSPVNSFVTTGALFVRVRDTVTLVEQTARVKLIANPEGELRPADITYTEPALDPIAVDGGEVRFTAFPNAQLQSGDAIIAEDALGAGLRQTGASVELVDGDLTIDFPIDAAFAVTVRAGERFSTAFDGLTSDVDIAVVEIADGAIAGLACADCRSANAGTSAEAVEFKNETATSRTVAVLIGRIEPEVALPQTDGGLTVAETVSFRCSTTVSVGPEFAAIDPVQPTTGPLEGGIPVRLRGSGFDPRARVFVGQAEALDVAIEAGADGIDIVTFTLPAAVGTENPASIIVENPNDPGDGQAATLLESFIYQPPAPVIDEIRPDLAPTTGGDTAITIAGRFFSTRHGLPLVSFGTVTVAATFVSSSELTVTAPPHVNPGSAATVSVKVRNRIAPDVDGAPVVGSASNGVAFRYLVPAGAPPTIVGVNPAVGSVDGGTRVTVEGTDLRPGLRVFFGSREASCDAPNTTTAVSCLTPAADDPSSVDVIVVNADAQSARRDGGYRYEIPAPFVTSVFPPRGITDGGTFVVVEGGGFRPGARVTFVQGGTVRDATAATRVSGTTMLVTTPAGTAGAAQLVIRNLDGQSVAGVFSYFAPDAATPPPSITALSPAVGDAAGGYPVVITGTGFLSPTVLFGSQSVEATFVDRTPPDLDELTVTAPASPTGVAAAVTVQVVNDDGQSATSGFNYTFSAAAPPRIDRISPSTFTAGQTTAFTISGARFDAGAVVLVGGLQAAITARSSTSISASIGGQLPLGAVQVVVENPNGSAVSIPVQVVSPTGVVQPAISAVSTSDVHADVAGDIITLFGAGLDQGPASVQVASVGQADPARPARVLVQNANFLVVELPAIPPGPRVLQASFDTASGTRTALSPTVKAQAPVVVFANGDPREDGRVDVVMLGDFLHPAALTSVVLDNAEPIDCNIAVATEGVIRCTTAAPLVAGSTYELALTWTGSFAGAAQPAVRRVGQEVGVEEPINGPRLDIVDVSAPIRGRTDFAVVPQTVTLTVPGLDPARLPTGAVFEVVVGNRGQQPGSPEAFAARGDASVEVDVVTATLDLGVLQFFGLDELPVSLLANGREVAFGFVAGEVRSVSAGSVGVDWGQGFDVALDAGLSGDENRVVAVRQQDRQIVVPLAATLAGVDLTVVDTRALAPGSWLVCLADQASFCDSTSNATFFVFGLETELEPNDTPQTATGVSPFGPVNGAVASPDVDQYFFRLDNPVQGYQLSVVRGCTPGMTARLSVRASGVTVIDDACASASPPVNLPPDEYLITVATSGGEPSTYQLQLGSPGGEGECGNGIVEPGEQCDEGGSFFAQCDSSCIESIESNDFDNGLQIGSVPAFGARTLAINDTDVFTFLVNEAGTHQVSVTSRQGEGCNGAFAGVFLDGQLLELDFLGCVSAQIQLEPGIHRLEVQGSLLPFKYQVEVSRQTGGQCGNGFLDPGEQCDEAGFNGVPVVVGGELQVMCASDCTEPPPGDMVLGSVNVPRTLTPGDIEVIGVNVPTRVTLNVFTTLRNGTVVDNLCAERIRLTISDFNGVPLTTSTSGDGGCAFASVVVPPGRYFAVLEATSPGDSLRTLVGSFQTEAPPEVPCGNGDLDPAPPPSGNGLRTDLAGGLTLFGGVAAGVTVDGDGTVYIVENDAGRIRRRTAAGIETTLVPSPAALQKGADIELGPDGFLYVADGFGLNFRNGGAANRVLRVDRVSGTSTEFASSVNNPSGLAFDAAGNLLVASFSDQRIIRFAPDGTPLGQFGPQLPVLPNDIEVRADGTIMIAGFNPDLTPATAVFQMLPDGSTVTLFGDSDNPTIHDPHSLVFDGAGDLWVTFYNGQTLGRFGQSGFLLQTFPGGFLGPELPNGIAIDRAGALYVVTNASLLYRLDNLAAGFGEACDDGNVSAGDGCSSVCTVEPGFVCSGQSGVCVVDTCRNPALDPLNDCEVDNLVEAVNLPIGVRSTRAITGGDEDFFKFTVPPGVNSLVSIFDNVSGCAGNGFGLEAFQNGSSAGTLTLFGGCYQDRFPENGSLEPGTYVMRVTGRDGVPVPSYEFAVANCGDGRQEFFESCDDGNTIADDGCSSSCQQEPDFLCTGSPSTCSPVICQSVDLTIQPGAPFLAAAGTFSGNGYQPGVRTNVLSTENLAFPVSVSVDVDWVATGDIGFVGVRSSGLPVGVTEEPEDSVYLRLHIGIGANRADLAVGPSPITVPTTGTMPSPQFGAYGVRMVDDGVNVSARVINLQQPGVPPLELKTSTPVQPAPGNNRVVFGGQSVLFRNATICQGAP